MVIRFISTRSYLDKNRSTHALGECRQIAELTEQYQQIGKYIRITGKFIPILKCPFVVFTCPLLYSNAVYCATNSDRFLCLQSSLEEEQSPRTRAPETSGDVKVYKSHKWSGGNVENKRNVPNGFAAMRGKRLQFGSRIVASTRPKSPRDGPGPWHTPTSFVSVRGRRKVSADELLDQSKLSDNAVISALFDEMDPSANIDSDELLK